MGSGIYSLGTGAMFAAQAMLDTTAHNISNVNTPGYSRQRVELATAVSDPDNDWPVGLASHTCAVSCLVSARLR